MKLNRIVLAAVGVAVLAIGGPAHAAFVAYSFGQQVAGSPPSTVMGGSAPWLGVTISDVAPGTVSVSILATLTNSLSPPQTLTGIWLNIPSVAGSLTGLTIMDDGGTGVAPFSFTGVAPNNSTFSTTQSIVPVNLVAAQAGRFNIFLKFPNSGVPANVFQDHETKQIRLIAAGPGAAGLMASAFNAASLPTAGGNAFFALTSITNAGGSAASGIAFLAPTAVPEPASLLLVLASSGVLIGFTLRRRNS